MSFSIRASVRRRLGWEPLEAKLIDQKFVSRDSYNAQHAARVTYQVWDYMVEIPGGDGGHKRLVIREKSFKLELPEPGGTVPVLVNRQRTKAMFDLSDPRIDAAGIIDRRAARRKARDEARFEEKLRE